MNRRGMGVGQAFTFILVVLTFSLITIFGYKIIGELLGKGEKIELVQFQKDVESSIKLLYTDFGSVREEEFRVPGKFTQVCFVDMDFPAVVAGANGKWMVPSGQDTAMDSLKEIDPIAYNLWQDARAARSDAQNTNTLEPHTGYDSVEYNVFLQPPALFKVYRIRMGDIPASDEAPVIKRGFLCPPINHGTFSLRLEGKGDHTELSESIG